MRLFALIAFTLLTIMGCTGHRGETPTGMPDTAGGETGKLASQQLFAVKMHPQTAIDPPFGKAAMLAPSQLPLPEHSLRRSSYDAAGLTRAGGSFDTDLPLHNVDNAGNPAGLAQFAPAWDWEGSGALSDAAYCAYRFTSMSDYGDAEDEQTTIGFTWTTEPDQWSDFFVGVADYTGGTWDWFAGPDDGVLTLDGFADYYSPAGDLIITVLMLGDQPAALQQLVVGAPEERAMGGDEAHFEMPDEPGISRPMMLPISFDLSPQCAPVNDQKRWPSCTCFAVGDGAYNYELNRIYGSEGLDLGWDFSDPFNRISPKQLYIVSGEIQGFHPPAPPPLYGRYTDWVVDEMQRTGAATEWNVPYDMKYRKNNADYSDWSSETYSDMELLKISNWDYVQVEDDNGIWSAKAIIYMTRTPIILSTALDTAFLQADYANGAIWDYSGPTIGYHAMLITGYDDTKMAFKVRNSWSADWGAGGYCWISYNTLKNADCYHYCTVMHDEYDAAVASRFCDGTPPVEPPTGVQASDGAFTTMIRVNWTAVPGATGYRIFRDDMASIPIIELGDETSWDDTGVAGYEQHFYWVCALKGSYVSPLSTPDLGYMVEAGAGEWTQYGANYMHNRRTTQTGPASPDPVFSTEYYSNGFSCAFANTNTCYITDWRSVYGVLPNGTIALYSAYDADSAFATVPAVGPDGSVYMADDNNNPAMHKLRAYNADLSDNWTFDCADGPGIPVVGPDGTIYISAESLYALHPDGSIRWQNATLGSCTTPAVADNGTLYVGSSKNCVAVNVSDGSVKWSYELSYFPDDPVVGNSGEIYIPADGKLYALSDMTDHAQELWQYTASTRDYPPSSPAVAADGTLYVAVTVHPQQFLQALDPASGTLLWQYQLTDYGALTAPVVDSAETVFIPCTLYNSGMPSGTLFAINPDGTLQWTYDYSYYATDLAFDNNGRLYLHTDWNSGHLYILDEPVLP